MSAAAAPTGTEGLSDQVIWGDPRARVTELAGTMAGNAPLTVKAAKAAINAWERGEREEDLRLVHTLVDECFDSEDYKEGRRAFREKRTPDFRGR